MRVSSSTRWKIAERLNRLRRFCWCDLVDYVLSHRDDGDVSERQFLFRRARDEDGDVSRYSMLRSYIFHHDRKGEGCQREAATRGSCYCGKFATKEVRDKTSLCPKFVVLGITPEARLEHPNRTDGWLSA